MTEPTLDWILARRSIRRYHRTPVEPEKIEGLLQAAMAAPSANNKRPWHFIVVQERERLDAIARTHPYAKMVYEAPLVIAVCADLDRAPGYWEQDCAAATQNILLAATTLGLGSVWLGVHPREERETAMKSLLKVPEGFEILSLIAVGYGAEEKDPRTQYDPARIHHETW